MKTLRHALFLTACALTLGACTFPQTKMEPVGSAQTQASQQPAPATSEAATSAPASAQSASAAH